MYDLTPSGLAALFGRLRCSERAAWIAEASRLNGKSRDWYYARARAGGWESGRKRRADAGQLRSGLTLETVHAVAALKIKSRRDNGKMITGTRQALSELVGQPIEQVEGAPSLSTVNRVLRRQGLSPERLGRVRIFERVNRSTGEVRTYVSEATGILHSDYPNQLHQVDTSVCILYSFGKTKQLKIAAENTLYKNKPQNFVRLIEKRKIIIRYVLVDHCSGAVYWRYFEAGGENAADMGEFLWHAWRRKSWLPFHGAPEALRGDAGAGLENHLLKNGLDTLGVNLLPPLPGNKEANGAVENAHNLVERMFESTLSFASVPDLADLNALAARCCAWINNCYRHSRLRATRSAVWSMLPAERLREVPAEWEDFRQVFEAPETRKVARSGAIQFGGLVYRTRDPELAGETVTVHANPYDLPSIVVSHAATGRRLVLHPLPVDRFGRLVTGANQAAGTYDRLTDSQSVRGVREALAVDLRGVDSRKLLDAMGEAAARTDYLGDRKTGSEISAPARPERIFDEKIDAKDYLLDTHGPLGPELLSAVHRLLPDTGITIAAAEAALEQALAIHRQSEERRHA